MIWVRSLIFNICFFALTAVLLIGGLPVLLGDRHSVFRLARMWSRMSLWLLDRICGLHVEFRGVERIPSEACLMAAKHQSALETFALVQHVEDFSFILKRELTLIPLFGWYLKRAQMIGIDRASGRAALEQAITRTSALLAEGRSVVIFPEGTRTKPGAQPKYKAGVAQLYAATGASCIPIALNTGVFWPRRSFRKYPGHVVIEFLDPIAPGLERGGFLRILQDRIEKKSNELLADAKTADPSVTFRTI